MLTKYLWEAAKYPADRVKYIVEHGCGAYSSQIIARFASDMELTRVVIEMNDAWAKKYVGTDRRFTNLWSFEQWLNKVDDGHRPIDNIGLVLIDGDQHDRQKVIELCSKALFLVVHDTEMLSLYDYDFKRFGVIDGSYNLVPETKVLQLK